MPCPLQAIAYICLKSNMDRFIGTYPDSIGISVPRLKSNMDRFIGMFQQQDQLHHLCLKSNMDRFIVVKPDGDSNKSRV